MGRKKSVEKQGQLFSDLDVGRPDSLFEKLYFRGENALQSSKHSAAFGMISGAQALELPEKEVGLDAPGVLGDFFDVLDFQRKQRGNLLGVFADGEYEIGPQMRTQLLLLPKKFEVLEDNVARAAARLGPFTINFKVEFDISNTFCGAKLFVVETESDIDENIKHVTLLDEVLQVYDFYFRDAMFKKWNIFREEQQLEKIGVVQKYLEMQADDVRFGRELEDILAQLYLVRMLQFLNGLGEKGQKARREFAEVLENRMKTSAAFSQEYATQKILLDNVLMQHGIFEEVAKSKEGLKILNAYSAPLKNFYAQRRPVIEEVATFEKKPDEKAEKNDLRQEKPAKAKPAEKSAGGASGGGGTSGAGNAKAFSVKDATPLQTKGGVSAIGGKPKAGQKAAAAERPAAKPPEIAPTVVQANAAPAENEDAAKFEMGGVLAMAQALVDDEENDSKLNMQQTLGGEHSLPFEDVAVKNGQAKAREPGLNL